jgi:hypothetical protein
VQKLSTVPFVSYKKAEEFVIAVVSSRFCHSPNRAYYRVHQIVTPETRPTGCWFCINEKIYLVMKRFQVTQGKALVTVC